MSFTRVAPEPVLCHSSAPLLPSLAEKRRVPLTLVRSKRYELPLGLGVATSTIGPKLLESCIHSWKLLLPLLALKKSVPFTLVKKLGLELARPGLRSSMRMVLPPPPPVVRHSSRSLVFEAPALKNSAPLTLVSSVGYEPVLPLAISRTKDVPALVPLLSHSST